MSFPSTPLVVQVVSYFAIDSFGRRLTVDAAAIERYGEQWVAQGWRIVTVVDDRLVRIYGTRE